MSKAHWNCVDLHSDVSDEEIKRMIDHSYDMVVAKLTKPVKRKYYLID